MVNPNSNTTSANTDNNIVQVTTQGGNIVNVTQPVTNIIEVKALGPAGPIGPKGDPGGGFPFVPDIYNNGIAAITGSLQVSGGVIFRGRGNSNVYTDTFNIGYYVTTTRPVTGSGLIISSSNLPANHYNFLKIGNTELVDININGDKDFIIHVSQGFQVSTGEDIGGYGTLFKHNGQEFEVDINNTPRFYITSESAEIVGINLIAPSITSSNILTDNLQVNNTINGVIQTAVNSFTSNISTTTQQVRLLSIGGSDSFAYPLSFINNEILNGNNDYGIAISPYSSSLTFTPNTNTFQVSGSQIISGTLSINGSIINGLTISGGLTTQTGNSILFPGLTTAAKNHVVVYDTTDGRLYITASNAFGGGGSVSPKPEGANFTIQFNDNESLGGSSNFIFDNSTNIVSLTGSLLVSGDITTTNTIQSNGGFIGGLTGTASFASTASFVQNAISSSFASTASFVQNAQTASYILNAESSSFASTASFVQNAISSSFASTASFVQSAQTASKISVIDDESTNSNYAIVFADPATGSAVQLKSDDTTLTYNPSSGRLILGGPIQKLELTPTSILSNAGPFSLLNNTTNQIVNFGNNNGGILNVSFSSTRFSNPITASIISASSITGSLFGTASFALTSSYTLNAESSSFASTASFVQNAQTASYVLNAESSSFASTASFVQNAQTASYVLNAESSSFASTASFAPNYVLTSQTSSFVTNAQTNSLASLGVTGNTILSNNLILTGSFDQIGSSGVYLRGLIDQTTATSHVVTFDNSTGKLYITASNAFGGGGGGGSTPGGEDYTIQYNNGGALGGNNNFRFIGGNIVSLTGSLLVSGGITTTNTIQSDGGFTGDLIGTASFASTASFVQNAQTASYVLNTISSSFASTASFVQNSISSSFASTASFVRNAVSASFAATASSINTTNLTIEGTILASGPISGNSLSITNEATFGGLLTAEGGITGSLTGALIGTSSWSSNAVTASHALTASFVRNSQTASFVQNAQTASYVLNAISSSFASTASFVQNSISSSFSLTSSLASRNLLTASVNLNTITFTKGDGSPLILTINTGSGASGFTPSLSTDLIARNITASANISASGDLSIRGFSSVSASIASLSTGVGTLAQVTALGASTTTPITASIISASLFIGPIFGTASSAVSASRATTASFVTPLIQAVIISGTLNQGNSSVNSVTGIASHVEGSNNVASGIGAHAEGNLTTAGNAYAHAEGKSTSALGMYSHAEGENALASNIGAHAEGRFTEATGEYSHAEGVSTKATNTGAHAEGQSTLASGQGAHSEGQLTTASANYSHAAGLGTIANATHQFVVGSYNITSSDSNVKFIIGGGTNNSNRSNIASFSTTGITFSQSLSIPGIPNVSASIASASRSGGGGSGFPFSGSAVITGSLLVSGSGALNVSGGISQIGGNIILKGLQNQTTSQLHVVTYNNSTGQLFITASNAFGGGGGGSTPGGIENSIQYNNAGALNGSSNFTLIDNGSTANISLTGSITATQTINADEFNLTGTGIPTIVSDTNLNLSASNAVVIQSPVLRLRATTTSSISSPLNGDIIYDSNQHKFFGYANGVWVAFH